MLAYLFIPALVLSLCFYLYSVYRCRMWTQVLSKAFTSLLFVAMALAAYWVRGANRSYFVFILLALSLCACGDVFLEISRHDTLGINYFVFSIFSFFAAHVAFLLLFWRIDGLSFVEVLVTLAIVLVFIALTRLLQFDFYNMEPYLYAYMAVFTFTFVKSLSLLYGGGAYLRRNAFAALGAGFFFFSNVLYAFSMFYRKPHRLLPALSTCIYYAGQTFLALSVLFAQ